jgi:hypothetical protein
LDVVPISRSSRNTGAFSSPGASSFFSTARGLIELPEPKIKRDMHKWNRM